MRVEPIFQNRTEAGKRLAERVKQLVRDPDALILALPRGGVPVGLELARALNAELDVFLVRKLGLPGEEELAIGAIASGGVRVLNESLIRELQLSPALIDQIAAREEPELKRREALYRQGRPAIAARGRTVILVDDGLATGASMKAACQAVRVQQPKRLIVAVPVAAQETCWEFQRLADEIVCLATPEPFMAVGIWYEDFEQISDEEVQRMLKEARSLAPQSRGSA